MAADVSDEAMETAFWERENAERERMRLVKRAEWAARQVAHRRAQMLQAFERATQRNRAAWLAAPLGKYRACTFENFQAMTVKQQRALAACRQWPEIGPDKVALSLVLLGGPGRGKTHLLAAVGNELHEELGTAWADREGVDDRVTLQTYQDAELLVLDDIDMLFATEAERRRLFELLDARNKERALTMASTNLTLEQLEAAIGPRSLSRLLDQAVVLALDGPDRRRALVEE